MGSNSSKTLLDKSNVDCTISIRSLIGYGSTRQEAIKALDCSIKYYKSKFIGFDADDQERLYVKDNISGNFYVHISQQNGIFKAYLL